MTNSGVSHQGEGSAARGLCVPPQQPSWWTQTLTWPLQCVRLEVVIHTSPEADGACISIEASDPHTRELVAKAVQPSYQIRSRRHAAEEASAIVETLLLSALDPDPF